MGERLSGWGGGRREAGRQTGKQEEPEEGPTERHF